MDTPMYKLCTCRQGHYIGSYRSHFTCCVELAYLDVQFRFETIFSTLLFWDFDWPYASTARTDYDPQRPAACFWYDNPEPFFAPVAFAISKEILCGIIVYLVLISFPLYLFSSRPWGSGFMTKKKNAYTAYPITVQSYIHNWYTTIELPRRYS